MLSTYYTVFVVFKNCQMKSIAADAGRSWINEPDVSE